MPVNKSVMNRHRDRHHQSAFPYDGFSGIQQRVVIAASLLLCACLLYTSDAADE